MKRIVSTDLSSLFEKQRRESNFKIISKQYRVKQDDVSFK